MMKGSTSRGAGSASARRVRIGVVAAICALLFVRNKVGQASEVLATPSPHRVVTVPSATAMSAPPATTDDGRVQSRHHCFVLPGGGAERVDVLGEVMPLGHYCVLENVCEGGGHLHLFNDAYAKHSFEFPRQPLLAERSTHFYSRFHPMWENAVAAGRVEGAESDAGDLTVIMRHAYCCSHPKHFSEPLPALHAALRDLEANATRRRQVGLADNFRIPRVVVLNRNNLLPVNWTRFALDTALFGAKNPTATLPPKALYMPAPLQPRCYRRAVVPGAIYHLFQSNAIASAFREAAWARVAAAKAQSASDVGAQDFEPSVRRIVYASRKGRREISDESHLVNVLRSVAAEVNATVDVVQFGSLPAHEQGAIAHGADILIGLHGADLTNMIFQRPGASLLELNPAFFFESAFREMAQRLFVHYDAWTCTSSSCAFGGDLRKWRAAFDNVQGFRFNPATRVLQVNGVAGSFVWPPLGYTPEVCQPCLQAAGSGLASVFYTSLRDSPVRVLGHEDEIRQLLVRAFRRQGWVS